MDRANEVASIEFSFRVVVAGMAVVVVAFLIVLIVLNFFRIGVTVNPR